MSTEIEQSEIKKFTVLAIRKGEATPLLLGDLLWDRLMEDVVIPFDSGDLFFIDGAPVKATDLDRIKILLHGPNFASGFHRLHWSMRTGDVKTKEMYAKQYPIFIEALLRENCVDVTSQVISAFRTAIKPKLKDFIPDKKALLDASVSLFTAGLKAWTQSG
jgi:hypothetical protein